MKHELTIIAPEELTVLDKIKLEELIKKYARIRKRVVDGRKRLAYPIQGREWGLYLFYELEKIYVAGASHKGKDYDADVFLIPTLRVREEQER